MYTLSLTARSNAILFLDCVDQRKKMLYTHKPALDIYIVRILLYALCTISIHMVGVLPVISHLIEIEKYR